MQKRNLFFISDGTGITAETLAQSLLSQFEGFDYDTTTLPYVDTLEKAEEAALLIEQSYHNTGHKPLVFATLVNKHIHARLSQTNAMLIDFFTPYIQDLEQELGMQASGTIGRVHGVHNTHLYNTRIDAINHTLATDDGLSTQRYGHSDVILIGVSRCGKTPTCLYLAMQLGLRASNFPFTEEVLDEQKLPADLLAHKNKLFGLTIQPKHLQQIRTERRGGRYATLAQCQHELDIVEGLFQKYRIPFIDTTMRSIEEIATKVVSDLGLKRQLI